MKNFGFTINVDKDTNYIISHTESNWASLRNNSLININKDSYFYTIGRTEQLNFITDFTVNKDNKLKIEGNYENLFISDDILTISYKEYELLTIKTIINKGNNYKRGDVLSLNGGILSTNLIDNKSQSTILQVEEVDSAGGINRLKVLNKGIYLEFPNKENTLIGNGNGAQISLESNLIKDRKMIERQVISAQNIDNNTIIELNYKLPENVSEGKISMSKYKAFLTSNYVGQTKRNAVYSIVRDISPIYGLPLLIKGSNKTEEYFNYGILELEKKIKELEDRLNILTK